MYVFLEKVVFASHRNGNHLDCIINFRILFRTSAEYALFCVGHSSIFRQNFRFLNFHISIQLRISKLSLCLLVPKPVEDMIRRKTIFVSSNILLIILRARSMYFEFFCRYFSFCYLISQINYSKHNYNRIHSERLHTKMPMNFQKETLWEVNEFLTISSEIFSVRFINHRILYFVQVIINFWFQNQ